MLRSALAILLLAACSLANAQESVPTTLDRLYIPGGYDSNDNVQFVGEGMFRNTCYRPAPTGFRVDHQRKEIRVQPTAFEYLGICLQVILPFDRVIDIGILNPGIYTVIENSNGRVLGKIPVSEAKVQAADDYLYAPISQVFLYQAQGEVRVVTTGEFTNSCMKLEKVVARVEANVIVLQPIASMDNSTACRGGIFPFSHAQVLPPVPRGRYLLHARSINGKAINTLTNIY